MDGLDGQCPILPWMLAGDFNTVCTQDEKAGGQPITYQDTQPFTQFLHNLGLSDAGYSGNRFTWTNNRLGSAKILQRLDRAVLNSEWTAVFNTNVTHLSRTCFDHAPLLIQVFSTNRTHSSFRFLNV